MRKRQPGKSGLEVSAIVFGCMDMSFSDDDFTADDLSEIDRSASKITVQGDRYPEELMRMTGR